ncbi:MAG TPA: hypothetical protein VM734_35985 [Kofleriaceae bacterium]|nr:hypothetical protein [Kofleriaceae bacterium]
MAVAGPRNPWSLARWAPALVILLGLGLAAPALTASFAADDHLHRIVARDQPGIDGLQSRPHDLFVFADGEPVHNEALRDAGVFPWWTDPSLRLAFFRPVSSATHAVDHALWPDSALAQLAHNLLWLAVVLGVTWAFYRRFLGVRAIAVLALALYAVDDARGPVVGWIANRNALVALALAIPVLLAHDRWRRDGWTPGRWVGPAGLALALGAGESALAITAYLGAHALWLDRGRWGERALALVPYLVIVVAWRVLYDHLGYGVTGSGVYLDPGADPTGFAAAAIVRLPLLLVGQLALPWSDFASIYPVLGAGVLVTMVALAVATIVVIGLACARLLRRDPVSRFFATGMVLAAVPVASTFPADRLLGFVGLGAMGLIAQLLAAAARRRQELGDGRPRRAAAVTVAVGLAVVHLVLSPPLLALRSRSMVSVARVLDRADAGIPADPGVAGRTVILAAAPSDALAGYIPLMRQSRRQPRPAHLYWLATGTSAVSFERLDERTLRVIPAGGLLRHEVDQMMRSPRQLPFDVGDRVALTGLTVEIEAVTADGRPSQILAHFDHSVDDPALIWLRWEGKTYVPYQPPRIGARDTLPAVEFLELLE